MKKKIQNRKKIKEQRYFRTSSFANRRDSFLKTYDIAIRIIYTNIIYDKIILISIFSLSNYDVRNGEWWYLFVSSLFLTEKLLGRQHFSFIQLWTFSKMLFDRNAKCWKNVEIFRNIFYASNNNICYNNNINNIILTI